MTDEVSVDETTGPQRRRIPATSGGSGRPTRRQAGDSLLPPPGPAWAGSLMGTFGAVTLMAAAGEWLGELGFLGRSFEWIFTVLGTAAAVVFAFSWSRRRIPGFAPESMPAWAMTSMATVLCGSAWAATTGSWLPYIFTWLPGTALSLYALARFWRELFKPIPFMALLPTVAPAVPATAAAQWAEYDSVPPWLTDVLHTASVGLMVLSLLFAVPCIIRAYKQFLPDGPPVDAAATAWVPLGVMGQVPTAMLTVSGPMTLTTIFSLVFLTLAIPMASWAIFCQVRMLIHWPRFNPTWWSSTFPPATLGAASHELAINTGINALNYITGVVLALLIVNWTLAAIRLVQWSFRRDAAGR